MNSRTCTGRKFPLSMSARIAVLRTQALGWEETVVLVRNTIKRYALEVKGNSSHEVAFSCNLNLRLNKPDALL